mmetsp:Transcript_23060/g.35689  ORF Transcript_23060/g.35689 Transcript_23060/m.35689 type:complete len:139 (-) Transcript_23060:1792-2208(-)
MRDLVHGVAHKLDKLESNYNYGAHRISLNSIVNDMVMKAEERQSINRNSLGSGMMHSHHSSSGKKNSIKKYTQHQVDSGHSDKNEPGTEKKLVSFEVSKFDPENSPSPQAKPVNTISKRLSNARIDNMLGSIVGPSSN